MLFFPPSRAPVETQPWICRKKVGGRELTNASLMSDTVELTPVETLKQDKEEHCHHGKSHALMLQNASFIIKCIPCRWVSKVITNLQNWAFWKQKQAFFLPFASYFIKDEEVSMAMVTHHLLLFYPYRCRYVISLFLQLNLRKHNDLCIYNKNM